MSIRDKLLLWTVRNVLRLLYRGSIMTVVEEGETLLRAFEAKAKAEAEPSRG